jgi:hypothetical protein
MSGDVEIITLKTIWGATRTRAIKDDITLYQLNHNIPDKRDMQIAEDRINLFNDRDGPRVGDFIIVPGGLYLRFAYDWGDQIQTTDKQYGGSFHIGNGYVSMSGGLEPGYLKEQIELTNETRRGYFWIEHHGHLCADCSIGLMFPCRVYITKDARAEREELSFNRWDGTGAEVF